MTYVDGDGATVPVKRVGREKDDDSSGADHLENGLLLMRKFARRNERCRSRIFPPGPRSTR